MRAVHTVQLIFIMCIVCIVRPVLIDRIKPGFLLTGRSKHAAGYTTLFSSSRGLKPVRKEPDRAQVYVVQTRKNGYMILRKSFNRTYVVHVKTVYLTR